MKKSDTLEKLEAEFGELIKKMAVVRKNEGYSKKYHDLVTVKATLNGKIQRLRNEQ